MPEQHDHHDQHRRLNAGDMVTAHFIHGDAENPTLFSKRGVVHNVGPEYVTVALTEDVPELGLTAGQSAWGIPHRCWHPHPRVETL